MEENKNIQNLFDSSYALNPRQIQALHYLMAQGKGSMSILFITEASCGINRTTAIADLKAIESMKLVESKK